MPVLDYPDVMFDHAKMKRLRDELGLSQEQAAAKAKLPGGGQRWYDIESGRRGMNLKLDTLYAIAAALRVDPCELLVKPKGKGKR